MTVRAMCPTRKRPGVRWRRASAGLVLALAGLVVPPPGAAAEPIRPIPLTVDVGPEKAALDPEYPRRFQALHPDGINRNSRDAIVAGIATRAGAFKELSP